MKTFKALCGLPLAPVVLLAVLLSWLAYGRYPRHQQFRREALAAVANDLRTVCTWRAFVAFWVGFMSVAGWLCIWAGNIGSACACFGSAFAIQLVPTKPAFYLESGAAVAKALRGVWAWRERIGDAGMLLLVLFLGLASVMHFCQGHPWQGLFNVACALFLSIRG